MFTLIGDLVDSRRLPDRAAAQARLSEVLASVSDDVDLAQPLQATIGDEFQGGADDLAPLLLAGLLVRLRLAPVVDVRCGYGHGEVTVHDPDRQPLLQDGPGWWAARAAVDELGHRRTARSWYAGDGPDVGRVNAFLLTRDALVDRLKPRGLRLLDGMLCGLTQRELARREGISEGAVSQQVARGVGAVREAHRVFDDAEGGAR